MLKINRLRLAVLWLSLHCVVLTKADAQLITNPAVPIDFRVTINPVVLSNNDGSNSAAYFGTSSEETQIKELIDTVWAQAGIDIAWQAPEFWNSSFANIGTPGNNNPRPRSDLGSVVSQAAAAGFTDPDPSVLNLFFVQIAAGFSQLSENSANGIATVGGNGITQHVGDNLVSFGSGRDVVASVVAHEIGHNLGLFHLGEDQNLMLSGGPPESQGERLNQAQIDQVRANGDNFLVAVSVPGDFNLDGSVDLSDLDQYIGNLGLTVAANPGLAALDLDENGAIEAADFQQHYTSLVETANGQTGTFAGDANLDGVVDVLVDAAVLIENLGSSSSSWSSGDFNGDGMVDVLGDAAALVDNLGNSNEGAVVAATSAVPEPRGLNIALLATMGLIVHRKRPS